MVRAPTRAIRLLEELVQRRPDARGLWERLAQAYEAAGRDGQARTARERARQP